MMTLRERFLMALREDCPDQDVTAALFPNDTIVDASIVSRETGVFSGRLWLETILNEFTTHLSGEVLLNEGDHFFANTIVMTLKGPTSLIVRIERVLLNLLQHLCGISTLTDAFVTALDDSNISLLDTRKTLPLWRDVEKLAVVAGGGKNHRFNLSDLILIKENHLCSFLETHSLDDLGTVLEHSKETSPHLLIEMELETLEQCRTYPLEYVDFVLLDNFSIDSIEDAVLVIRDRGLSCEIEVSGNVSLDTISGYRGKPIDRISVGKLTHSVKAIDFSLLVGS